MNDNFALRKWYFDCIDSNGNSVIAYAGQVVWRVVRLSFSGLLTKADRQRSTSSIAHTTLPEFAIDGSEYRNRLFNVSINSPLPPIHEILFENEKGSIEWLCHYPSFKGSIETKTLTVIGYGYAEELVMTIKPWEMKIDELRWGRFVSEENYISWIEWKGEWPLFFIWHNGVKITHGTISDSQVLLGDLELHFIATVVLRSGSLLKTVFNKLPIFKKLFPLKALMMDETKWQSRTELRTHGKCVAEGWSIHEKILFP